MHNVHTKRGFTLIELLVVIAIIGILATIVIIQLAGAQTRARNSNAKSDVTEMGKAVETWKTTNTDSVPASGAYTAATINSSSTATSLGANGTAINGSGTPAGNGGWGALFNTVGTFPVTVSKTPSANYTYFYVSNNTTAATNAVYATQTATSYCVGTNVVTGTGGVTDTGFYVMNGGDSASTATGGGVTVAANGICS